MAHTSINSAQVRNFLGEQSAPFLFNSGQPEKNSLGLVLSMPGEKTLEKLRSLITKNHPPARILEIAAPAGKDSLKQYREFLSEMLYRLGEPPLRHGQETAVAARLLKILSSRYDYLLIDHAERMGTYSLEMLRRDRGCPAVVLIAQDDQILETLLANETLLKQVYMLS